MKVGLFFGSFNPIHCGHLALAQGILNATDNQQIWFVVTPLNPHKKKATLLPDFQRLNLVRDAIEDNHLFKACDIEFHRPAPHYTAVTLAHLIDKYPEHEFTLMLGEDNLRTLDKWYNYNYILENHKLYVYPRAGEGKRVEHKNISFLSNLPLLNISSSYIRTLVQDKKSIQYLVPDVVKRQIEEMGFYK